MPHTDEGRLQAWLDGSRGGLSEAERDEIGSHVASCDACADLLAELRATDAASRDLLGALGEAEPAMPDFSEVVARSRSLGSPTRQPATPVRRRFPVQWAASIVVAVGVGWMANEVVRTDPGIVAPRELPGAATAPDARSGITDDATSLDAIPEASLEAIPEASLDAVSEAPDGDPDDAGASANSTPVGWVDGDADAARAVEDQGAQRGVAAPATAAVAEALASSRPYTLERARSLGDDAPSPDITSVSGRVTGPTGEPLQEAVVSITGTSRSALSGPDGRFRLDVPSDSVGPNARLQAVFIGYATATRDVPTGPGERVLDDLRMEPRAIQLEGAVVTGTALESQRREFVPRDEIRDEIRDGVRDGVRIDGTETWEQVSPDYAASLLGARPLRLTDLPVTEIGAVEVEGVQVIRVTHEDVDRGIVHFYQARTPFELGGAPDRSSVDRTTPSGIYLALVGTLDVQALRSLLDRAAPIR